MSLLVEVLYAIGFNDAQAEDFLTLLSIADQEKVGTDISVPTHDSNLQKAALIEEASQRITLDQALSNLQKKGVTIDQYIKQQLVDGNDPKVKILLELNDLAQRIMIRPVGSERQQLTDNDKLEQLRPLITAALTNMGYIDEVKPKNKNPDVLLVLGASQAGFTERLNTTVQYLEEEHVKPSALYLLGGQRPLWAVQESVTAELVSERIITQGCAEPLGNVFEKVQKDFAERFAQQVVDKNDSKQVNAFRESIAQYYKDTYQIKWPTELDMMVRVAEKSGLKKKGLMVIPVDTPMQRDELGNLTKRPTTKDTIESFKVNYATKIAVNIDRKISVLATSSQPHINYQSKPIEEVLGAEQFDIETVGKGVNPNTYKIREAFDAVARSIFSGLGITLKKFAQIEKGKAKESEQAYWQTVASNNSKEGAASIAL